MKKDNLIMDLSFDFSLKIIQTYKYLVDEKREYVLSKQLLRAATSIGANICEANYAISKKEFISKTQISLKEAAESQYWLKLLHKSGYLTMEQCRFPEIESIIRVLTSIINTAKKNLNDKP